MRGAFDKLTTTVERFAILRFFTSFTPMMTCYGVFLFLYEVRFLRELIPSVHPVLIVWALAVAAYSLLVKRDRHYPRFAKYLVVAFLVSAAISALVNIRTGALSNAKAFVMTALPLVAFLPYCASCSREDAEKRLLTVLLGPAAVTFVCSLVALLLYLFRVYATVEIAGITHYIGLRTYTEASGRSVTLLYGIYVDTNHAALYSLASAIYSIALISSCRRGALKCKSRAARTTVTLLSALNLSVQLSYFPLANSRGGWLSLGVAAVFVFFTLAFFARRLKGRTVVRASVALVSCLLATLLCLGALLTLRTAWATLSQSLNPPPTVETSPSLPSDTTSAPPTNSLDSFDKTDATGSGRLEIWADALRLFVYNPVFGHNPGNSEHYARQHLPNSILARGAHYHNSYIDLLLDYGAVGFALLISLWAVYAAVVLRSIFGKDRRLDSITDHCAVAIALLVAVGSAFLSSIFINTTATYFLFTAAVGYLVAPEKTK